MYVFEIIESKNLILISMSKLFLRSEEVFSPPPFGDLLIYTFFEVTKFE